MTGERLNTGYAALQKQDDPFVARGMALGAGDLTRGGSGKATYWPPDVVESAAEDLAGQPFATSRDHTANKPRVQTPPQAIAGEVRWSGFGEVDGKAGVLYETEVDDEDIARNIEHDRLEVSPLVFRNVVPVDEYDGAYADDVPAEADAVATEIKHWRDLAAVRNGASPSNHIEPGAATAMSAEDLHATVEALADPGGDDGQDGDGGPSTPANDDTPTMDLTDKEQELVAAARQTDDPVVVEAEVRERLSDLEEQTDEHEEIIEAADDVDDPEVMDTETADAMRDRVSIVEEMMDQTLVDQTGLREGTVEAMSFDAKAEEFRDDEGEFDAEALAQNPETGEASSGGNGGDGPSDEDVERIEEIDTKLGTVGNALPNERVEALQQEAADLADADDYEGALEVL